MTKPDNNKPYPLRLGEYKPFFQQIAVKEDRSLHYVLLRALKEWKEKKEKK